MIPEPYEFVLLALAAARAWKLIGDDRILDRPREAVLNWIDDRDDMHPYPEGTETRMTYWGDFLVCPWCAGFWVSLLTYATWIGLGPGQLELGQWYMGAVVVFAISASVGVFGTVIDKLT